MTAATQGGGDAPGVLAVVVVYERDLAEVRCWTWLRESLRRSPQGALVLRHVLIYDNSATARTPPGEACEECTYVHDAGNGGTAAAYQHAARLARSMKLDWLLLLDQDTSLPSEYLAVAARQVDAGAPSDALVPWVTDQGRTVSPARTTMWGSMRPLRPPVDGGVALTAVASGCLIRAAALYPLLPFPAALWLDYVDHWLFARLRDAGGRIAILEVRLEHRLSILTPAELSPRRLRSILDGERYFLRLQSLPARILYPLRLLIRILRYALVSPRLARAACGWVVDRRTAAC